jgi:Flp pilus assembly protein TadG
MLVKPQNVSPVLRRLGRDASGVAFTEFALALPVLLALGLTGLETANLALAHLKVSNIAVITADNAARVRDSIDEADVANMFIGAKRAGESINFTANGRIILSSIEPNAAGTSGASTGQWIRWQRCIGAKQVTSSYGVEGAGKTDATIQGIGPVGNKISAQPGTAVLVVEVNYTYQPLVSSRIFGARTITYLSAFNVRQRTDQALYNAGNMAKSTCDKFNA